MSQLGNMIDVSIAAHEWKQVLVQLRADGFSPIDSIKITRAVLQKSLAEAKQIVHFSGAWIDPRDDFDRLHHEVVDVAASI
jgi:ribosomal protein L7/L12